MRKIILLLPLLLMAAIATKAQTIQPMSQCDREIMFPTMRQFLAQAGRKWQVAGYRIQYPDVGVDSIRILFKEKPDGTTTVLVKVARKGPNGWMLKSVPKRDWALYVHPHHSPSQSK
jgi:hypothetical protein